MPPAGPELLTELLARHGPALVLLARQWCDAPEDVVQEALVQLARQQTLPEEPKAWLFRVVRNGAISAGRGQARRRKREAAAALERPWFEDRADEALDAQAATAALAALPAEEREVVAAHLWGGLTFAEIGRLTETSASTAHRRYEAGLAALRERLRLPCTKNHTLPN
jgi:RNA polymerase sigma factor (sigma-70 family)